jgi:hypothetical protein
MCCVEEDKTRQKLDLKNEILKIATITKKKFRFSLNSRCEYHSTFMNYCQMSNSQDINSSFIKYLTFIFQMCKIHIEFSLFLPPFINSKLNEFLKFLE